jgi:methylenetetrahydrofolate dehydrogenase (NADP+)/methenyltetrahydrofolate cyclohydrolase
MAGRLEGRVLAEAVRSCVCSRVTAGLRAGASTPPGLLMIRVGEDPASVSYVRGKEKAAAETGIVSRVDVLELSTSEAVLLTRIAEANRDPAIHGLLVQRPLPAQIRPEAASEAIDPGKDVDGLHPYNLGRLALGRPSIVPCTPLGILALLHAGRVPVAGARVVVLGRSQIVGRPLSLLLGLKADWADATVTIAHSHSRGLVDLAREADILVAAIGRPGAVTAEMVKRGATVVDVGIHRLADPVAPKGVRIVGDVDTAGVEPVAGWLTPVPGGVGPLTVAMLLANTMEAWERARGVIGPATWMEACGLIPRGPVSGRPLSGGPDSGEPGE